MDAFSLSRKDCPADEYRPPPVVVVVFFDADGPAPVARLPAAFSPVDLSLPEPIDGDEDDVVVFFDAPGPAPVARLPAEFRPLLRSPLDALDADLPAVAPPELVVVFFDELGPAPVARLPAEFSPDEPVDDDLEDDVEPLDGDEA